MVDVWLPYGKTDVCVRIPVRNFLGSVNTKESPAATNAAAEVERALGSPIGSRRLREIAKADSKVSIVVDDATRHAPSDKMILPVLSELNATGVKDEQVTIIFGCGTHRAVTEEEAKRILSEEICKRIRSIS